MSTLSRENKNRGMWFDQEQLPFCGTQARVDRQVRRVVDERTGEMIKLSDCVVLKDVVCEGRYRRACPRAVTPYWRESWLRRVEPAHDATASPSVGQCAAPEAQGPAEPVQEATG